MTLNKEPKTVDLYIQSKPWTEGELKELSEIIRKSKVSKTSPVKRRKKAASKKVEK